MSNCTITASPKLRWTTMKRLALLPAGNEVTAVSLKWVDRIPLTAYHQQQLSLLIETMLFFSGLRMSNFIQVVKDFLFKFCNLLWTMKTNAMTAKSSMIQKPLQIIVELFEMRKKTLNGCSNLHTNYCKGRVVD